MKLRKFNTKSALHHLRNKQQRSVNVKNRTIILSVGILILSLIYFTFASYSSVQDFTIVNATVGQFQNYYSISLITDGGYVDNNEISAKRNSTIAEIPIPVKNGYTFNGWYDENELLVTDATKVKGDMVLYAHYNINTYTLSVDPNNGTWESNTGVQNYQLVYNTTKNISNPTKTGYTFENWTVSGSGSSLDNDLFTMGYEDTTLTANYSINSYNLTIKPEGGTWENSNSDTIIPMDYNTSTTINDPVREGYTFAGWQVSSGILNNKEFTISDSDATLTATWIKYQKWIAYHKKEDIGGSTYTIVDADTAEGEAPYNSEVTPSVNTYTGFISPNSKTITIQMEENYPPTLNVVNYEYERFKGTVTINPGEGTYTGDTTLNNVYFEETKTINNPTLACYDFNNWTINGDNSSISGTTFTMGSENTTLTANYTIQQKTATYNAHGGSVSPGSDTVNCGSNVILPEPIKTGYTFDGWYDQETNGNKVGNSGEQITITSSITLHAHWTPETRTITYNGNSGTPARNSDTVDYDSTIILPTATKASTETVNYILEGWYDQETNGTKVGNAGDSYTVTANKELYAYWSETPRN